MRYIYLIMAVVLISCGPDRNELGNREGWAPIYASAQASTHIEKQSSRATANPGKIYAYNQYLFQVEQGQGIHIIDNSDPQQASKIGFISIPLCTEIAIKSNYLYTNNLDDMVVINIANINDPQLVSRVEDAFPNEGQNYPPMSNIYFECVDPSKGVVVGWERKILSNPKCRR